MGRKTTVQRRVILLKTGQCFRRAFDSVAAIVALLDELRHFFQIDVERNRVIPTRDFGERMIDVDLPAIELGEKLLDRAPFFKNRRQPLLQALLLGADLFDARAEVAELIAAL